MDIHLHLNDSWRMLIKLVKFMYNSQLKLLKLLNLGMERKTH
jgi:hypothetical protein